MHVLFRCYATTGQHSSSNVASWMRNSVESELNVWVMMADFPLWSCYSDKDRPSHRGYDAVQSVRYVWYSPKHISKMTSLKCSPLELDLHYQLIITIVLSQDNKQQHTIQSEELMMFHKNAKTCIIYPIHHILSEPAEWHNMNPQELVSG